MKLKTVQFYWRLTVPKDRRIKKSKIFPNDFDLSKPLKNNIIKRKEKEAYRFLHVVRAKERDVHCIS